MINVSVITPCYKGNRYLSVLQESLHDNLCYTKKRIPDFEMEWIVVNDYPEEKIILPSVNEKLPVRIIEHVYNQGIHQARVTGLSSASGRYIVFLDQDDTLLKNGIYEAYKSIGDADLLIENAWLEDMHGNKNLLYKTRGAIKNALCVGPYLTARNQIVSPGHCLIKRSSIPDDWTRYILKINGSDDLYLWLLMFGSGAKLRFINKPYYTHKYTGRNLSENEGEMAQSSLPIANYLKQGRYYSNSQINRFIRSRKMRIKKRKKNPISNLIMFVSDIDIVFLRGLWKLRAVLLR